MEQPTTITCEIHGTQLAQNFTIGETILKKVCFICFVNKVTEGLHDFLLDNK